MDCVWEEWETWSTCSRTCGDGFKVRIRTIKTKEENNGNECSGSFTEHDMCHTSTPCGNMDILKSYMDLDIVRRILCSYICIISLFCILNLAPCAMVTCTSGFDAKSDVIHPYGICQCVCGTSLCDLSISNTCVSGVCKCGTDTQCDTTSTIPVCVSSTGATPDWGDSTATCKVCYISQSLFRTPYKF